MYKSLVLMAALAAGAMMGCQQDNDDSDRPDPGFESSRTGGTAPPGSTAGPDRGTRSGGTSGTGTGSESR